MQAVESLFCDPLSQTETQVGQSGAHGCAPSLPQIGNKGSSWGLWVVKTGIKIENLGSHSQILCIVYFNQKSYVMLYVTFS